MTDNEIIKYVSEFRDGVLGMRPSQGMCGMVSLPLESLLPKLGVKVTAQASRVGDGNHIWLQMEDGRVLDPTADQFNENREVPLPPVYLGAPLDIHAELLEPHS